MVTLSHLYDGKDCRPDTEFCTWKFSLALKIFGPSLIQIKKIGCQIKVNYGRARLDNLHSAVLNKGSAIDATCINTM